MSRLFIATITVVFLTASFAGCVQDEKHPDTKVPIVHRGATDPNVYIERLSKAVYTEILKEHVLVPSFDGKGMDNWVFRPKVEEGTRVPVFINFSPYWYNSAGDPSLGGDAFSAYMVTEYVPRGYAVVLSSVRGTGHSEGCFNIGGDTEKKDAYAVVEYFGHVPWSNGNVSAGGKSYDGTTANGVSTLNPPSLKSIFPVSGISEMYKYSFKGGIIMRPEFTATYFQSQSDVDEDQKDAALIPEDAACPDLPGHVLDSAGNTPNGDYTAYWQERNYTKDASKVTAAVFMVHGFTDWNVKPDNILPFLNALPKETPRKAWLHNWTATDASSDGHVYPRRDDWNVTMLRFLDETLKGIDTGLFDEPAYEIQDSEGTWMWEETWPPARAVSTKYYFGVKEGQRGLDPSSPFRSGPSTFIDNGQGPTAAAQLPNYIQYVSAPLDADLHYSGVPRVHVQASTDRALGKIVVSILDIAPDGTSRVIDWGGLNMRHRVALESPQPVIPDTVYDLSIELHPQVDVVPAGHRIGLTLAGGGNAFFNQPWQSQISILENEEAYLELPVITTFDFHDPQPVKIPCFACPGPTPIQI
jgi:X-Pro dipeptidyl-peptidase